jgi:hypothetical protein
VDDVQSFVLKFINNLNLGFTKLNIFIALVGLDVWDVVDKFHISDEKIEDVLSNLENYLKHDFANSCDNVHILIGKGAYGSTVGIAPVGSMCEGSASCGVSSYSKSDISIARTVRRNYGNFPIL